MFLFKTELIIWCILLPLDAPVQLAIDAYLEDTGTLKFRGRPRCTLPTTLGEDLRRIGRQLRNSDDIVALRTLDRRTWGI